MDGYLVLIFSVVFICTQNNLQCAETTSDRVELSNFIVNQLKTRVLPNVPLTSVIYQFRNDNLYWINWLKANSFNVTKASKHFLQNLNWREEQKIDTIHSEDWSNFQAEYPLFQDSFDKAGRPIMEVWFSEWNIRQAVMSGRTRQVIRWLLYNLEMCMRNVFQMRANGYTNLTGAIEIIDYSGINIRTYGCSSCLPIYETFQNAGPLHYPGILEEIYMLNLSQGYKILISLWQQNLSKDDKNALKVYGREREWMTRLKAQVSQEQLSTRFGGTKDRTKA